jgi:hypothetical protein
MLTVRRATGLGVQVFHNRKTTEAALVLFAGWRTMSPIKDPKRDPNMTYPVQNWDGLSLSLVRTRR